MLRRRFPAAAACWLAGFKRVSRASPLASRPKLLILLVAEQFRTDYLDARAVLLGLGGFRRLIEQGSYFPECRLACDAFTGTGLATLATGTYPDVHGIVADRWFDRERRKPVAASAEALQATTIADMFQSADKDNRVFGAGFSAAHAGLVGGVSGTNFAANAAGDMVALRHLAGGGEWVGRFGQANAAAKNRGESWFALNAQPNAPAMRVLRYDAAKPAEFVALFESSPQGQAQQFSFLRELIVQENLGRGAGLDYAAVSLGSLGLLGYEAGADSPLVPQLVMHLDRQIESLFLLLNSSVGAGNYAIVFAGAHGAPRHREQAVSGQEIASVVNRALSEYYGEPASGNWVQAYIYPFIYLRADALSNAKANPREARELAGRAALGSKKAAAYYTLDGDSSHTGEWQRRLRNSFHSERSGDLMLAYPPDFVEDYGGSRGISYGSIYNYDTRVPLMLFGAPFRAETFDNTVELVDVAPTLARVFGLPLPSSSTGRVLGETFRERR